MAQVVHGTFFLLLSRTRRTQCGSNHWDKASSLRYSKGLQPPEHEEPDPGTGVSVATDGMGSSGGGILPHVTSQASSGAEGRPAQGAHGSVETRGGNTLPSPNQIFTEIIG